jgi:dimethylglycine dehydrogenase
MVKTGLEVVGTELEIEILGEMYKATVVEESPFDPTNVKLRA